MNGISPDNDLLGELECWRRALPLSERKLLLRTRSGSAAKARNVGVAQCTSELVVFLDDDIVVQPDFLSRLRTRFVEQDGWVMGRVDPMEAGDKDFAQLLGSVRTTTSPTNNTLVEVSWLAAGNLCIDTERFQQLGGFDEKYLGAGAEDLDLALRASAAGLTFWLDPTISCLHLDWASRSLADLCKRERLYAASTVRLVLKHGKQSGRFDYIKSNLAYDGRIDGIRTLLTKYARRVSAHPSMQSLLGIAFHITTTYPLLARANAPLYRFATAGAIYGGVQDGLRQYSSDFPKFSTPFDPAQRGRRCLTRLE